MPAPCLSEQTETTTMLTLRAINTTAFGLGLALVLTTGIETVETAAAEEPHSLDVERNGMRMNGINLNGIRYNGIAFNGVQLNGPLIQGPGLGMGVVRLLGGSIEGEPLANLGLVGSGFAADLAMGDTSVTLGGTDLVGAQLWLGVTVLDADSNPVDVELTAELVDVEPLGGSTLAHHIRVLDSDSGEWVDPCPDNAGTGLVALAGTWDPQSGDHIAGDVVTLACRGDVLAKCVEWGYEPWVSSEHADLHQACTRMARADYCGDGTPMTVEGTTIDVYDSLGIQTQATAWPVEAEWGPDGATCIGGDALRAELLGLGKADCIADLPYDPECGALTGEAQLANGYAG